MLAALATPFVGTRVRGVPVSRHSQPYTPFEGIIDSIDLEKMTMSIRSSSCCHRLVTITVDPADSPLLEIDARRAKFGDFKPGMRVHGKTRRGRALEIRGGRR